MLTIPSKYGYRVQWPMTLQQQYAYDQDFPDVALQTMGNRVPAGNCRSGIPLSDDLVLPHTRRANGHIFYLTSLVQNLEKFILFLFHIQDSIFLVCL